MSPTGVSSNYLLCRYRHKKTGRIYFIVEILHIKIPFFRVWISVIKYSCFNSAESFYRVKSDFERKFENIGELRKENKNNNRPVRGATEDLWKLKN